MDTCNSIGVPLAGYEVDAVCRKYKAGEDGVRYMDFIDEAYGLIPASKIQLNTGIQAQEVTIINVDPDEKLTEAEEDELLQHLVKIGETLKQRNLNLIQYFLKHDAG